MQDEPPGSITRCLDGLKAGDSLAAQQLWNTYFQRLVAVAETRLQSLNRESSGEDIALSALKSVMLGVKQGHFPDLTDRENLWPLLVTLTANKSIDAVRRQRAKRRDAGRTETLGDLHVILGAEPSPDFAVQVADEMERLVRKFDDETLRTIAQLKLENRSNNEIAAEIGCSTRTVIRKLNLIRQEWEEESDEELSHEPRTP